MSRAHSLFRLQEIDLALDKNMARLEAIKTILEDSEDVRKAKSTISVTGTTLESSQSALRSAEHKVETQRSKISETEKLLYGGSITNPKELQDLQMEAESLKRYLATLEDRLLDEMVALEQAELDHDAAQSVLENILSAKDTEHQQLREEQGSIERENQRLENSREAALVSVSEEDLKQYQKLREKQGGYAVAILEVDGSCSMCGLSLSASQQQLIRSGTQIDYCSQCKRILYAG
jgi:predicted  nucleic acid-binding Zn-ribbon protein